MNAENDKQGRNGIEDLAPVQDPKGGDENAAPKLMSEMLSNVSKVRSEISMTFARNSRA